MTGWAGTRYLEQVFLPFPSGELIVLFPVLWLWEQGGVIHSSLSHSSGIVQAGQIVRGFSHVLMSSAARSTVRQTADCLVRAWMLILSFCWPSSSLSLSLLILWMMHGVPDRRSTHWKSTLTFADKLKARTGHYFTPHWALGSQTFSLTIMEIVAAGTLSHKSEIWRSTCFNSQPLLFHFRFDLQGFL